MKKVHLVSGRVECPDSLHLAACLRRYFEADGCQFVHSPEDADIVVLNGCERIVETPQVVRAYRDYAVAHGAKTVLVVGCVPTDSLRVERPENFYVVPFRLLVKEPSLIGPRMGFGASFSLLPKDDIFSGRFPLEEEYPGNPPPAEICLLTIGSGCNGGCTYCTIKRGRGFRRSLPLQEILGDAKAAIAQGKFRFVLLGDDAGCWGQEVGLDLADLLAELAALCPAARFLVRPLNPVHLAGLYNKLRPFLPRVDYLYVPIQSGCDRILGLMNRGYQAGPILALLRAIKADHPSIVLKTDIIVGFPGESRAEFRQSVLAAQAFDSPAFHRFVAYPGTPAASMPGTLPPEELRLRMSVVEQLGFSTVDPSTYSYDSNGAPLMNLPSPTKSVHVVTGNNECLNNTYLAACLERFFEGNACTFTHAEAEADVLVLNVCNVLVETPGLIHTYREVARNNPAKHVLVLGCVPGGVSVPNEVPNFHVIPYGKLVRDPALIGPSMGFSSSFALLKAHDALSSVKPPLPFPPEECCFVTIGSGCEGRCTYCSIRAGRGAARSLDPDEIVADAKAGLANGRFRLVLIADDAGCWGRDLGLDLPHLLGRLRDACPSARFAILDFNPRNLPDIFEGLRPFLSQLDFLYLPLQSGNDRILRLMDRGYRAADILALVGQLRQANPEVLLETDLIVGFPGETRQELLDSVHAAKAFTSAAFIPYVPKADTPACRLPGQLSLSEMKARLDIVRTHGQGHPFKIIDTSMSGIGHGAVGKLTTVLDCDRSSPVLQRPSQPCLTRYSTISLTAGCPLQCVFCDQDFSDGHDLHAIRLFSGTVHALARELDAKPSVPEIACFSSDCEPFVPDRTVLSVLHDTMTLLLDRGVGLLIETRCAVPQEFVDLFAKHADRVKVQVGMSSADDRIRQYLEPNAASVAARLDSLKNLVQRGVPVEVGVGPLTPGLDDSPDGLADLCRQLSASGVRQGAVSYLEVADTNRKRLEPLAFDAWSFREMAARLYTERVTERGRDVWRAEPGYRERKYGELDAIATSLGITLRLCRCNNPDQHVPASEDCPLPFAAARPVQSTPPAGLIQLRRGPSRVQAVSTPDADLLAFVVAGTDLRPRSSGPAPSGQSASQVATPASAVPGNPSTPGAPLEPARSTELRLVLGKTNDDTPWDALVAQARDSGAAGKKTLLPSNSALFRGMLAWLGRNGLEAVVFLSPHAVRVQFPDRGQDAGTASLEVTLPAPGDPCFQQVGPFGISYQGKRTPRVGQVADRIAKYLDAARRAASR